MKPNKPAKAHSSPKSSKATKAARPSPYAVPALERGMRIIEILAEARRPLSLTEVSEALGLASGMVYRLLRQMHEQQWLMQDAGSQKYSLSLRLYSFALAAHPDALLVEAARMPLEDLAAETKQSCHVAMRVGKELMVMAANGAPNAIRLTVDVGSRHSLTETTSGRLLLALRPETEWKENAAKVDPADLRRVAAAGYSVSHHRNIHGVHDVAVPVRLPQGHASLALTAFDIAPDSNLVLDFLPALRRTALRIEQALGLAPLAAAKP